MRSLRVNPLSWMLYQGLKALFSAALRVFYKDVTVINRHLLDVEGPVIVISNHPNTMVDPLAVGIHMPRTFYFLANYGLFKNPISNWLFRNLFCIPVKRKEDVTPGAARDNAGAFKKSFQHLEKGGALFIAAEGTSWLDRYVRPLKTGAARIGLGAEAANGWQLGTRIIPTGIYYTAPVTFRSAFAVNVGEPIQLSQWKEAYESDPVAAVSSLTKALEEQVRRLSLSMENELGDLYTANLETMLQNSQPISIKNQYLRTQKLLETCLHDATLREKTLRYGNFLSANGLSDQGLLAASRTVSPFNPLLRGLLLCIGLPFFLIAVACWGLVIWLPVLVVQKLKLYMGYNATVKILTGIFVASFVGWAIYRLGAGAFPFSGWVCLGAAVLLGFWAEKYFNQIRLWLHTRAANQWKRKNPERWPLLLALRQEILDAVYSKI